MSFNDLPAASFVQSTAKVPVYQNGQDEVATLAQFIAAFPRTVSFAGSASALRVQERVFLGSAAEHFSGNSLASENGDSWMASNLTTYPAYLPINAHLLVMNPAGKYAIVGASRNSDGGGGAIGVAGFVANDTASGLAWGLYSDLQHEGANAWSAGLEIAAKNKAENRTSTAYTHDLGVFGLWLAGGGDNSSGGNPTNPSNTAISVVKNDHTWNKGLIFHHDALTGADGTTGEAIAVEMAKGHTILWKGPGDIVGAQIKSIVNQANKNVGLIFDNDGILFIGANGTPIFTVFHVTNAVNSVVFRDNVTGQAPGVQAYGSDANIDFKITTKGTGVVQFGTKTTAADAVSNGYVTIKDSAGNLVKLMTRA